MPPHLPLCPPSSPCVGEEGGDQRSSGNPVPASFNDAASTHLITPLPQRGRGAGGEGRPQRGRGAGGEGRPQREGEPD